MFLYFFFLSFYLSLGFMIVSLMVLFKAKLTDTINKSFDFYFSIAVWLGFVTASIVTYLMEKPKKDSLTERYILWLKEN